ncbi:hypothetical protein ACFL1M_00235 [Patescibacteria group bacterium]
MSANPEYGPKFLGSLRRFFDVDPEAEERAEAAMKEGASKSNVFRIVSENNGLPSTHATGSKYKDGDLIGS